MSRARGASSDCYPDAAAGVDDQIRTEPVGQDTRFLVNHLTWLTEKGKPPPLRVTTADFDPESYFFATSSKTSGGSMRRASARKSADSTVGVRPALTAARIRCAFAAACSGSCSLA